MWPRAAFEGSCLTLPSPQAVIMMTEVDLEANAVSDALLPPGPQLSHRMARRQFGVATESPTSVHIELELLTTETLQHPGVSKT